MTNDIKKQILAGFGTPADPVTKPVAKVDVLRWMKTPDLDTLGLLYTMIIDRTRFERIRPPLSVEETDTFVRAYLRRCIIENPDSEWTDTRYLAGHSLVNWFVGLWRDRTVPRSLFPGIKDWLAGLYKEGDEDVRDAVINATLEHLFEDRNIAKFFADWKSDPVLRKAYADGMLWRERGGRTSSGNPPKPKRRHGG